MRQRVSLSLRKIRKKEGKPEGELGTGIDLWLLGVEFGIGI